MVSFVFAIACSVCLTLFAFYEWARSKIRVEIIGLVGLLSGSVGKNREIPSDNIDFDWAIPCLSGERSWSGLTNRKIGENVIYGLKNDDIETFESANEQRLVLYSLGAYVSDSIFSFYIMLFYLMVGTFLRAIWYGFLYMRKHKKHSTPFRGVLLQAQTWLKYKVAKLALNI